MSLSQWLCMAVFILSALLLGLFRNSWGLNAQARSLNLCEVYEAPRLLCGQKIALKDARVDELALIEGISVRGARRIKNFMSSNAGKISIEDLAQIKGIGPKTLDKLKVYFY